MRATADANGTQLETGNIVERKLRKGIEAGMEDADWSAFYEITRLEAGLPGRGLRSLSPFATERTL